MEEPVKIPLVVRWFYGALAVVGLGRGDVRDRERIRNEAVRNLRFTLAVIAFGLPIVLVVGDVTLAYFGENPDLQGFQFRTSISAYYYSPMQSVLVGSLCAMGVFMIAYPGYDRFDSTVTLVGGAGAIAAALLPTTLGCQECDPVWVTAESLDSWVAASCSLYGPLQPAAWVYSLHLAGGILLFVSMGLLTGGSFRVARPHHDPNDSGKQRRNEIYKRVSQRIFAILALLALLFVLDLFDVDAPIVWLTEVGGFFLVEVVMLWLFAYAWWIASHVFEKGYSPPTP